MALTHEYYGGAFDTFTVRPLPETVRICHRLGLRLTGWDGTLTLSVLAGNVPQWSSPAGRAVLSNRSMCWEIIPTDSDFAAFTGVDYSGSTRSLVFANTGPEAAGGRLTAATKASKADVWVRRPLRYGFRPTKPLAVRPAIALQTPAGVGLRSYIATDPNLLNVDVSDFGSGLYQLAQGRNILARWFADERSLLPPIVGPMLVLSGSMLVAASCRTAENTPPVYTAALPARSVVWRYHVFNAVDATGLSIDPNENTGALSARRSAGRTADTQFHLLPSPVVPGAISFEAVRAMPLAAQSAQRFALSRGGVPLCSPLPLAGFNFARPSSGAAPYSDIFVHLQPQ